MRRVFRNQSGAILITYALVLTVLLGFTALGVEVGRWYLVRSELSKAVDAAAMAGAKNISNPYVADVEALAREVGEENFRAGQLGTPAAGAGSISFTFPPREGTSKFKVVGQVSAIAFLAQLFGIHQVATSSSGVAQIKEVEIMMVLDKSSSMISPSPTPLINLKAAAISFLGFFRETEDVDKMGLITFNTAARIDNSLGTNFVNPLTTTINAITAPNDKRRATNAEDALDKSDNQAAGGFTDQTGVPDDLRVQQYLIFFTDGNPTAFRDTFTYQGIDHDAVAYTGPDWTQAICDTDGYLSDPSTGLGTTTPAVVTGTLPGFNNRILANVDCTNNNVPKWQVFREYPAPVGGSSKCDILESALKPDWFKNVARQKAINHAEELKAKGIKIYAIGFDNPASPYRVDESFLRDHIATGPEFYYYTPNSSELEAIFNKIAKEIRLRLVE